ncbi:MAG: hypothetical protein MUF54_02555, partial [Polyangiaceae bacterium]|nr:hypothetical protein [Polyangiaceae bacterium]
TSTSRHTLDSWQHAIDERIRAVLPNFSLFSDIQSELRRVTQRVQALEERLGLTHAPSASGRAAAEPSEKPSGTPRAEAPAATTSNDGEE